jgi:hypothetical protein
MAERRACQHCAAADSMPRPSEPVAAALELQQPVSLDAARCDSLEM